jgi:hypothetical protein
MSFAEAVEIAGQLGEQLSIEIERAIGERRLIRTLDSDGLLARAQERSRFQEGASRLERELADALARLGRELGVAELTIAALEAASPEAAPLCRALVDVRRRSADLLAVDRVNRELLARSLGVVTGYLGALRPAPSAYDRRGARAGGDAGRTLSRRA